MRIHPSVIVLLTLSLLLAGCSQASTVPQIDGSLSSLSDSSAATSRIALSGRVGRYRNLVHGYAFEHPVEWKVRGEGQAETIIIGEEEPAGAARSISVNVLLDTTIDQLRTQGTFTDIGEPEPVGTTTGQRAQLADQPMMFVFLIQHGKNVLVVIPSPYDAEGERALITLLQSFRAFDPSTVE